MFKKSKLCDFKLILTLFYFIQNTMSDQNQAPRFDPPLQSNYFFPEFNSTKPGKKTLIIIILFLKNIIF